MPNGTCHGCAQRLDEFISVPGQGCLEARVKNMVPWPIGKGEMGAIRHRDVEPDARCNGVIWFYNEDPTPPGGESYMGWFSNPVVAKAIRTFGGDPPPKPRPIESAVLHLLAAEEQLLESWDVTEAVRQMVKDNSCHSIAVEQPLHTVLKERGALTVSICKPAEPAPERSAAPAEAALPAYACAVCTLENVAGATRGDMAAAATEEGVPPEDGLPVAPEPESEPDKYTAGWLSAYTGLSLAEVQAQAQAQPPPPQPVAAPEAAPAPQPVTSRLTVTVDGQSHEITCPLDVGGGPVSLREAMRC